MSALVYPGVVTILAYLNPRAGDFDALFSPWAECNGWEALKAEQIRALFVCSYLDCVLCPR